MAGSDGALQPEFAVADIGVCFGHAVAFDPASRRYLLAWGAPSLQNTCDVHGRLYSSELASPIPLGTTTLAAAAGATSSVNAIVAEPGTFVVALDEQSPALPTGQETLRLRRYRADALFINEHALGITGVNDSVGLATGAHGATPVTYSTPWSQQTPTTIQFALFDRWFLRGVHGHGDADADGRSDLTTFQPGTSTLTTRTQVTTTPATFAIPGAQPVLLDWDGDGRTDRAVWEPSTGKWWMLQSSDGTAASVHLGRAGDVPVPGDYLGLGRDQAAVFRPSTGEWFIRAGRWGRP